MHKINFPQYYVVLNDNFGWPTEIVAGPFYSKSHAEYEMALMEHKDKSYSIGIKNLELEF